MKFGVLSTASIARWEFIPAVGGTEHEVTAIASRTEENARAVADEHDIPEAYGSYETLLDGADIDAVYIPLPNSFHAEWTKRAADRGYHVLCEKPLGVNAQEAVEMGEYCDERGVTLMEALMYRYHPRTERAIEVAREELGEVRSVKSTFHSSLEGWPAGTRLDPEMGGGSALDVGVYAISAARLFLGDPGHVFARTADTSGNGVDTQLTGLLEYNDGSAAVVSSSFDTLDTQYYRVEGTDGWLSVEPAFSVPPEETSIEYRRDGRQVRETLPAVNHYEREVQRFAEYVETDERPLTDATEAARTLAVIDALRESAETYDRVAVETPSP